MGLRRFERVKNSKQGGGGGGGGDWSNDNDDTTSGGGGGGGTHGEGAASEVTTPAAAAAAAGAAQQPDATPRLKAGAIILLQLNFSSTREHLCSGMTSARSARLSATPSATTA